MLFFTGLLVAVGSDPKMGDWNGKKREEGQEIVTIAAVKIRLNYSL